MEALEGAVRMKPVPDTPQAGIALMATAMMFAPLMDMFAKLLTDTMSPGSIAAGRFAMQSLILLPLVLIARQWVRPAPLHALAGCLLGAGLAVLTAALKEMPLPNVIAIFFVEPLILTLMSAYILGEGLGWRRLSAVTAGLVGALVVIRPNWEAFGPAAIYPVITAFCFASYLIVTRVMTRRGGLLALQFWTGAFAALAMFAAVAVGGWLGAPALAVTWPGGHEMTLLVCMGLVAALAHQMLVHAFARAEAGVLAPLQYLEIISATLIGWFVFGDFPDGLTWLGTAIIIAAGIYVIQRERQLARRHAARLASPGERP